MDIIVQTVGLLMLTATVFRGTVSCVAFAAHRAQKTRRAHGEREEIRKLTAQILDRRLSTQNVGKLTWQGKRKLRIVKRAVETLDRSICSFYLAPIDRQPLPPYRPGQFLNFELPGSDDEMSVRRCYSLSECPINPQNVYRVSVKRLRAPSNTLPGTPPGLASNVFHDRLSEGDIIEALPPAGDFYLDQMSDRPIVLIAGGVGITPLLSMFNWLTTTQSRREIFLFYGVRNRGEHAFRDHIKRLCQGRSNVRVVVFYSQPSPTCRRGVDFDVQGRVNVDAMKVLLTARNYEFYLCGPPAMMQSVRTGLMQWGVPAPDIKSESFGQSAPIITRQKPNPGTAHQAQPTGIGAEHFQIEFARSGQSVAWTLRNGSLLELAEACGINARCSCRAGQCGTCKVAVKSGRVAYLSEPGVPLEAGSCLPCIALPTSDLVLDM